MRVQPVNRITTDARTLADQIGSQTTESLIRAVSGAQKAASEGIETAREGAQAANEQVGQGGVEGIRALTGQNTSVRIAWRAGRLVGRVEGALRLASFGVRFWWKRRRRRSAGEARQRPAWVLTLARWGPAAIASACLTVQIWTRIRRRTAAA